MYGQELAVLLASLSMFGTFSVLLGGSVEFGRRTFYIGSLRIKLILVCIDGRAKMSLALSEPN